MKKIVILFLCILGTNTSCVSGSKEINLDMATINPDSRQIRVEIVPGPDFLHKFPLFLFFSMKNAPQMVLWAETIDGQYIDTLMITEKIGKMKWLKAPKDPVPGGQIRRLEALPVWAWKRGVFASDCIPLPTEDSPMADAVSQATPKKDFSVNSQISKSYEEIYLYFEMNHSTDFNDIFSADLPESSEYYNGGAWGSGQPALVYRAFVDFTDPDRSSKDFELIGHSSPSGKDGKIYKDFQGIDTALDIINSITFQMEEN